MATNNKARLERLELTHRDRSRDAARPTKAAVLISLGFDPTATAGEVAAAMGMTVLELREELTRLAYRGG